MGDPERGLRGVMSAILILEAITLLLGITAIQHAGASAPAWQIITLLVLAVLHIGACAIIKRRFAVAVIFVLQALVIACWVFSGAVGVMGIVFILVWILVVYMQKEFRRRLAAGTIAGQAADPSGPASSDKES